ncbi:hypothetical protein GCM10007939_00320 [Amylibacter marinus]|uniref:Serine aminopeptidase S33 domain-containing protein n=1 Tax=Amylibacter marinus TaxID=1475483 RepID=A0ABQ5VR70_9RHOB|nr:alpha/beta fold hydrolase [Amylibacter marinus]GLQ33749.1 hypothetical protein GCM10007939_00320 [Amylibacter marinus]
MRYQTPISILLSFMIAAPAAIAQDYQTGMKELVILEKDGTRHLNGFLWYPTTEVENPVPAHGNVVWEPISVIPDAPLTTETHPLVLLSHGMFGNARNQAWLASALTKQGYIVAAIDHPGTSTFNRNADQRRSLWRRPQDISRTLDYLLDQPAFKSVIDPARIHMAGHSLGGFTAVALAGGRFDPDHFDGFCADNPADLVCTIFDRWNVAKSNTDRAAMQVDLRDDRIKSIAVFDLGGTQTFSPESLGQISTPMIVYGAPQDISGLDLDVESRALVTSLSQDIVQYHEPEGLAHFDFLGVCTAAALDILKEEEPDDIFVCEEGRQERRAAHQMIVENVAHFFEDQS